MKTNKVIAVIFAAAACALLARADNLVSLSTNGWNVQADPDRGTILIRHRLLGTVIENARLNLREGASLKTLEHWSVVKSSENQLTIKTENPTSGWRIQALDNLLKISSTSYSAVVVAEAPATINRIPARTLETSGVPVEWQGTDEVKNGYGGETAHHQSYLPRNNADTMYFGLGQVSGARFHSLFDRKTDTAIEFDEDARLDRDPNNADALRLTLPVPGNTIVRIVPDYYTHRLGVPYYVPFDDTRFKSAPMVWSSWTSYYEAVTEADIVKNADWLAANLKPYGFQYVQLDDGYDRVGNEPHNWIDRWDPRKFPHGPQWLTARIRQRGLRAGLWLVPNAYAGGVKTHPDWYVRDKKGNTIDDYLTPTLDSTNPEVTSFLAHLFSTLDDWGFDYYKLDGEHAFAMYVPSVDHSRLHDPSQDLLANYRHRLETIRNTLGPDRFIEGCPAGTPLNGVGFFNSVFNGHDLYNNWQGMHPLFSSIASNSFLNHIVVYVMPGEGLELGEPMTVEQAARNRPPIVVETARTRERPMTGFGTTLPEARTLVTFVSLTGAAYPLASVMPELPKERVDLLKATMPTLPIVPIDLFSRGNDVQWNTFQYTQADFYIHNYPEVLDLKVNNTLGSYDVVGVTNWRSGTATKEVVFADTLGLPAGGSYVAFDFWNRKLLGTFQDRLKLQVDSHDTRVMLLHPLLERPQVLGTSRHLTGAFSISDVSWDKTTASLTGTSQGVPGDPYSLWLHVPQAFELLEVSVRSDGAKPLPVKQERSGDLLTLTFTGIDQPIKWTAKFAPQ